MQLGAMGHYELQRLLMYMDMNVTDAIMLAMDDSPRIYDEVSIWHGLWPGMNSFIIYI